MVGLNSNPAAANELMNQLATNVKIHVSESASQDFLDKQVGVITCSDGIDRRKQNVIRITGSERLNESCGDVTQGLDFDLAIISDHTEKIDTRKFRDPDIPGTKHAGIQSIDIGIGDNPVQRPSIKPISGYGATLMIKISINCSNGDDSVVGSEIRIR